MKASVERGFRIAFQPGLRMIKCTQSRLSVLEEDPHQHLLGGLYRARFRAQLTRSYGSRAGRTSPTDSRVEFVYFYSMGRLFTNTYRLRSTTMNCREGLHQYARRRRQDEVRPQSLSPNLASSSAIRAHGASPRVCALVVHFPVLYYCRLAIVARRFLPDDALQRSLILCSALCSMPFVLTVLGGQVSMIGFFALALAFTQSMKTSRY